MKKYLTNGSSAAETLKKAFGLSEENILPVNDLLSFGPLTEFSDIEYWIELREQYWFGVWKLCGLTPMPIKDLRRDFYLYHAELESADEINIVVGTSLGDQMMLAFLVMFFQAFKYDFSKVFITQLSHCNKSGVHLQNPALAKPDNMLELGDRFQLSNSQRDLLYKTWHVVSASSPEDYLNFIKVESNELPFLIPALRALVNRYPDKQSGLSLWQKHILAITAEHQPNTARIVGGVLAEAIVTLDLIGDTSVLAEIKKMGLSSNQSKLLKLNKDYEGIKDTNTEITALGKQVLNGELNLIDLIKIDDWIGGVHLTNETPFYWVREQSQY